MCGVCGYDDLNGGFVQAIVSVYTDLIVLDAREYGGNLPSSFSLRPVVAKANIFGANCILSANPAVAAVL